MRRAVGIVRVSEVGDDPVSPRDQRNRIRDACERDGLELVEVHEELDVSGGNPLERRKGLSAAVEAVEAGEADVVMVAYFDRLVRSLRVQGEVVERVEAAGGRVLALDFGEVSGKTAAKWLSASVMGMMSEYYRRSIGERAGAAQADAVARGVAPFPGVPPGYVRGPDGVLQRAGTGAQDAVRQAFQMRVEGATVREVRAFLRSHGIERTDATVRRMLANRVYLGEISFGGLVNREAHEPIVDRDLFERVQRMRSTRGRIAHSDRLLARLGVLRCGSCGSRLVVGSSASRYPTYKCHSGVDCPRKVAVSAVIAERVVVEATRTELKSVEGRATAERDALEAQARAERDQANLDAAIRAFTGAENEQAVRDKVRELQSIRDASLEEAHRLGHLHSALTVNIAERWEDLTLSEKRAFIRAVVERAEVFPGKGAGRIRVHLFGEEPAGD